MNPKDFRFLCIDHTIIARTPFIHTMLSVIVGIALLLNFPCVHFFVFWIHLTHYFYKFALYF